MTPDFLCYWVQKKKEYKSQFEYLKKNQLKSKRQNYSYSMKNEEKKISLY